MIEAAGPYLTFCISLLLLRHNQVTTSYGQLFVYQWKICNTTFAEFAQENPMYLPGGNSRIYLSILMA